MKTIRLVSISLAALAFATGIIAAYYWYRSSQVEPDPGWRFGPPIPGSADMRPPEPLEVEDKNSAWILASLQAFAESARLNKRAAIWTAGSILFGAMSAICGKL